eukprot:GHVQ01034423.1.p1 GENE.GHVQ01034423.1~~GHVQ01034423.1.p1  ORF type:complete len:360 (+),score=44.94 GHVQ01034423.1:538-1617(+)
MSNGRGHGRASQGPPKTLLWTDSSIVDDEADDNAAVVHIFAGTPPAPARVTQTVQHVTSDALYSNMQPHPFSASAFLPADDSVGYSIGSYEPLTQSAVDSGHPAKSGRWSSTTVPRVTRLCAAACQNVWSTLRVFVTYVSTTPQTAGSEIYRSIVLSGSSAAESTADTTMEGGSTGITPSESTADNGRTHGERSHNRFVDMMSWGCSCCVSRSDASWRAPSGEIGSHAGKGLRDFLWFPVSTEVDSRAYSVADINEQDVCSAADAIPNSECNFSNPGKCPHTATTRDPAAVSEAGQCRGSIALSDSVYSPPCPSNEAVQQVSQPPPEATEDIGVPVPSEEKQYSVRQLVGYFDKKLALQ